MQPSTLAKRAWWLLFIIIGVVYFYGLGTLPFVGPDEPRYAQVAREMLGRGDFITPTLAGQTWFEKPALLYWLVMASFQAFGVAEWTARLGPACAGVLTVALIAWLAQRIESEAGTKARGLGLATTACLATSAGLLVFSRAVGFDVLVTMTVTLSLTCFFMSELERVASRKRWLLTGCYAGIGLSLLAKGLIGVVIPCGVVGLYYLLQRRRPTIRPLGIVWGPLLVVAIAAAWYVPVIARHGWSFVDEFFIQHHFSRYLSNRYRHPQPFYFYLPIMALLALPWTAFLIAGVHGAVRLRWRAGETTSRWRVFAFAWLVVPVAFFSLSGSKLPGYILPALPGAALLAGERLARFARGEGNARAMRFTGALMLLGLAGLAFAINLQYIPLTCGLLIAVPLLLSAGLALFSNSRRVWATASVVGSAFLTVVLLVTCGLEKAGQRESMRDLLMHAAARGYGAAPVCQLHISERTLEFYAANRLLYDARGEPVIFEGSFQVADHARALGTTVLVIIPSKYLHQLTEDPRLVTEVIADHEEVAITAVRSK